MEFFFFLPTLSLVGHRSREELEDCVETLGKVDWPLETKIDVWNLLKRKKVTEREREQSIRGPKIGSRKI